MKNKFMLLKLLFHWILCQMLSGGLTQVECSSGIFKDFSSGSFPCCRDLSGSCRDSCENLSLVQLATSSTIRETNLRILRRFCPEIQVEFWTCMNKTLATIERGVHWNGRPCCSKAVMPKCQQGCAISASVSDLKSFCRHSDEFPLFTCIEEMEKNTECCSNANSPDCRQICHQMLFEKSGTVREKLEVLHKKCNGNVIDCVTKSVDVKYLSNYEDVIHCCNYGSSAECKSLCKNNMIYNNLTEKEIIDSLIPNCGGVNLSSDFWACFLHGKKPANSMEVRDDVSQIKQIGIDAAKLHCCEKARSTTCRRQCFNTYNTGEQVTRSRNFNQDCLNNNHEVELKRCLDEVDFPAELGCDGLSFCSNFNNRPTELFRNCNPSSDRAAFNEFTFWRDQNILSLPGIDVPINNISFCSPDVWHAIACILQLRPTTSDQHMSQICWDDCFDILSKCLDWRQMQNSEMVPATVCQKISPDSREPCVSVKFFLEPTEYPFEIDSLKFISPCRGHPCNSSSEICEINRNIHKPTCSPGCPMGQGSSHLIPIGEYVKIPSSINKGCYKVCRCSESGRIEKCQLLPCVTPKPCQMGNRTIEHGASINVECNMCSCFSEEITCTKKQCRMLGISENAFTTLPCNCPPHYVPVCGRNGKTYPSACLAKCVGLSDGDMEFGSCESKNPCENNDCNEESLCFPNKNICLSNMSKPCPQYKCVSKLADNCTLEPLTDTTSSVHFSLCSLIRSNKQLAYYGVFDEHVCKATGTVCGINGVTYRSECEALSDFSMIDYHGPCRAVGLIDVDSPCSTVKCPRSLPDECLGFIPTGSCCPVCGGALKIIYSRKQIDRGIYALKNSHLESLTLKSILRSLQRLIKTSSCYLSGFLTFETDLMLIVYNIEKNPRAEQIEICRQEAVKISNLISTRSHHFTSNLGLSSFILANYVKPTISVATPQMRISSSSSFVSLICLCIVYVGIWWQKR